MPFITYLHWRGHQPLVAKQKDASAGVPLKWAAYAALLMISSSAGSSRNTDTPLIVSRSRSLHATESDLHIAGSSRVITPRGGWAPGLESWLVRAEQAEPADASAYPWEADSAAIDLIHPATVIQTRLPPQVELINRAASVRP